tara:strand:+ start:380 stop:538 length:159 start_codon:yes stop_codon:yes gene_type:complete
LEEGISEDCGAIPTEQHVELLQHLEMLIKPLATTSVWVTAVVELVELVGRLV